MNENEIRRLLQEADEESTKYIAENFPATSEKTKNRLYRRLMEQQKLGSDEIAEAETAEAIVEKKPGIIQSRAFASVAACLLLVGCLAGGYWMLRRPETVKLPSSTVQTETNETRATSETLVMYEQDGGTSAYTEETVIVTVSLEETGETDAAAGIMTDAVSTEVKNETTTEAQTDAQPEETIAPTEVPTVLTPDESELNRLTDENFYFYCYVFGIGMLNSDTPEEIDWNDPDSFIRPATDPKYPDFKSFDSAVRSVYSKSAADKLMSTGRYLDRDGMLYCDRSKDGSKGYYAERTGYTIEITSCDGTTCHFTVHTRYAIPGPTTEYEPYDINMTAVYENGSWLLNSMES